MVWKKYAIRGVVLLYFGMLILSNSRPAFCQPEVSGSKDAAVEEQAEDVRETYRDLGDKALWEKIVSLPGEIVYFPLELFFDLAKKSIILVDETRIVPKTVDFLTADDESWAFFPVYSSRGGAGLKYFHLGPFSNASRTTLNGSIGIRRRQRYQFGFEDIHLFGGAVSADFLANYIFYSDEKFYGIGPDSDFNDETNYAHEQVSVNAVFSARLSNHSSLGLQFSVENNNVLTGRNKDIPSTNASYSGLSLPSLGKGLELARFQLNFLHDSRNRPGHTTAGGVEQIRLGVFDDINESVFGFWQAAVDIKRYFHLFYDRVLVLRIGGAIIEPFSNRSVPFYYMSELGHKDTIRGFKRGRFRDRDMVLGSIEYRYPLMFPIDAFIFLDAGHVSDDIFSNFSLDDLQYGYGGGFNIWTNNSIAAQAIVGKSKDGLRFYLNLNQEF